MNRVEEQQGKMRRGVMQKGGKGCMWRAEKDEGERERKRNRKATELKRGKKESEDRRKKIMI